jgi:hypothetical protein
MYMLRLYNDYAMGWMIGVQIPEGAMIKISSLRQCPNRLRAPLSLLSKGYRGLRE